MAETPKRTDLNFNEFRKLLLAEQEQILGLRRTQRTDMAEESDSFSSNEPGSVNPANSADNDGAGAILADRERDEALDENERSLLAQVEHALARLEDGTYGLDEVTGEPIPVGRLRAVPWATMTIESAERYQ